MDVSRSTQGNHADGEGCHSEIEQPHARDGQGATIGKLSTLSVLAHELRAPLMSLALASQQLLDHFDALDARQVQERVSTIHRRALGLEALVESLLGTTLQTGQWPLQPQPLQLVDLLVEVKALVGPLLRRKEQRLRLRAEAALPQVWADSQGLTQLLVNLITNASKFSDPGTPIDVRLSTRRGWVRVAVADRGIGLPPEGAQHLFEPYYQAPSNSLARTDGVGLGLSIVRSIVDAHGGRLGAQKRRSGGAVFWFELSALPVAPPISLDHAAGSRILAWRPRSPSTTRRAAESSQRDVHR